MYFNKCTIYMILCELAIFLGVDIAHIDIIFY